MKHVIFYICIFTSLLVKGQNVITEELSLSNGAISLPGTLSYPESNKKLPLVIFIHGSGNVDRNGNQKISVMETKANYIKLLSDSLNTRGIAFYRYDKRTSVPENLKLMLNDLVFDDIVDDAKIVIDHFKNDKRFSSLILIGHSQGSLTAMLATDKAVKKYISLAGPAASIDVMLTNQMAKKSEAFGPIVQAHFKELKETDTILKVNPYLVNLFIPKTFTFINSWMRYIPTEEIKNIKASTLIIQGDADIQVTVKDAESLYKVKPDATLVIIKNMNHVLKEVHTEKENQESYYSANFALSSELVETVAEFIKQ